MKSVAQTSSDPKTTHVRYIVLAMIFIVSTLNYASRATLSMAGSAAQKDLGFNSLQLGYLFSAFGYTYVLAQIPGGWLLDRFGSKNVYALSILTWSAFTFLQGFAGAFPASAALVTFFALRLLRHDLLEPGGELRSADLAGALRIQLLENLIGRRRALRAGLRGRSRELIIEALEFALRNLAVAVGIGRLEHLLRQLLLHGRQPSLPRRRSRRCRRRIGLS